MTAALYDEVVTVAPARKLHVVRDATPAPAPAPKKVTRRVTSRFSASAATRWWTAPLAC